MSTKRKLVDFNDTKDEYSESIARSIRFAGKGHDYYTKAKADAFIGAVAKRFPHLQNPSLLDIGCGHGLIHPYLKDRFAITGTDTADQVLDIARKDNPDVTYVPSGNGHIFPFADKSFDLSLAICVMHHVPPVHWNAFLSEIKRVTKYGVFIFEHNPFNPLTRYVVSRSELDEGVTLLSQWKLERLMESAGLRGTKSENILFTPFSTRLDRALKWCPLGAQYFTFGRAS